MAGMKRMKLIAAVWGLLVFVALPAQAQQGIGFAQAEEGTWYCRGDNATATLKCAQDKCRREASGQQCYRTRWCYGRGWSGLMTVWLSETHGTEILCGAPNRAALMSSLKAFCEGNEWARECSVSLVIDPEGKETETQDVTYRGGKGQ